jgi:Fe-Mn family superoxide dismutase
MFELPDLPYAYDALEPAISARTMQFHHDKHHKGYVDTTNALLKEAGRTPASLEDAIREAQSSGDKKLFNNAAQAWNHAFFWKAMAPTGGRPEGDLAAAIQGAFGDNASFKKQFVEAGVGQFGSGWAWLTADAGGQLKIVATHDAGQVEDGATPLLVCDVWEHAYYLDHQNNRKGFLEAWFDALPNWSFAAMQFAAARGQGEPWRYPKPAEQLKRAS